MDGKSLKTIVAISCNLKYKKKPSEEEYLQQKETTNEKMNRK